ncbi:MAG: DUF4416 family protein [Candidatus Omnitrophota bacterium]|nr:MAG: DUF4416 family protein [Candidatus Omnitrophota bacterium]
MGQVRRSLPVKLITGIITGNENNFDITANVLTKKFGAIDYKSPIYDFNLTNYYQKEMGPELKRQFLSFSKTIAPAKLAKIKLFTNKLEKRYSKNDKRLINVDPGYVTASKLVLATTKDYSHRIYLDRGIFAEVTLYYKNGTFNPWGWTYPDYKTKGYIESFNHIREIYMLQMEK